MVMFLRRYYEKAPINTKWLAPEFTDSKETLLNGRSGNKVEIHEYTGKKD